MKNTTKTLVVLIINFSLVLTACANRPAATPQVSDSAAAAPEEGIVAEGKLKPIHAANLSFQARGMVEEISVQVGDGVSKGDLLARLANASQAEAQLATARLEVVSARQALDLLNRTGAQNLATTWSAYLDAQVARAEAQRDWDALNVDDIEDRIDDADAEVEDRQSDLKDAQDEFDKYKDLDKDNSKRKAAEDELEQAQEDYNDAVRKLEETSRERDAVRATLEATIAAEVEAKHQYDISADGVNKDQLELAQSRLDNATAQVGAAEANLANYVLIAPFDGVVADVAVEVGEQVSAESRAVSIADTTAWIIETTDVTELEVVNLEVGQPVTFTADALPDVIMNGTVVEISQSSFIQGGDVIYTVRIQAEEVDLRLKWGMTVEVNFEPLEK